LFERSVSWDRAALLTLALEQQPASLATGNAFDDRLKMRVAASSQPAAGQILGKRSKPTHVSDDHSLFFILLVHAEIAACRKL